MTPRKDGGHHKTAEGSLSSLQSERVQLVRETVGFDSLGGFVMVSA